MGQLHTRQMPQQGSVRVEHALWIAGGAGSVDNNCRIIRSGRNQLVVRRGGVDEFAPCDFDQIEAMQQSRFEQAGFGAQVEANDKLKGLARTTPANGVLS